MEDLKTEENISDIPMEEWQKKDVEDIYHDDYKLDPETYPHVTRKMYENPSIERNEFADSIRWDRYRDTVTVDGWIEKPCYYYGRDNFCVMPSKYDPDNLLPHQGQPTDPDEAPYFRLARLARDYCWQCEKEVNYQVLTTTDNHFPTCYVNKHYKQWNLIYTRYIFRVAECGHDSDFLSRDEIEWDQVIEVGLWDSHTMTLLSDITRECLTGLIRPECAFRRTCKYYDTKTGKDIPINQSMVNTPEHTYYLPNGEPRLYSQPQYVPLYGNTNRYEDFRQAMDSGLVDDWVEASPNYINRRWWYDIDTAEDNCLTKNMRIYANE